jgi:hypothetical protein
MASSHMPVPRRETCGKGSRKKMINSPCNICLSGESANICDRLGASGRVVAVSAFAQQSIERVALSSEDFQPRQIARRLVGTQSRLQIAADKRCTSQMMIADHLRIGGDMVPRNPTIRMTIVPSAISQRTFLSSRRTALWLPTLRVGRSRTIRGFSHKRFHAPNPIIVQKRAILEANSCP